MDKHYKSKIAAIAVGTAIKVLTGVVCGAVVLTGTYGVVKHTVLPNSTAKTQSMFAYEGEAGTGGTGGSIGDNPVYQTELKRNGVIPAEGTYKVKATNTVLSEGDNFPETPATGDTYEEGDYSYTYNKGGYDGNEWSVVVKSTSQTSYGELISEISGKPLTYLHSTFEGCSSLTAAPRIPNTVINMYGAFGGCSSLTTAPVIPSGVTDLGYAFSDCTLLKTYTGSTDSDGDLSNFIIPNGVTNMTYTFGNCSSITKAPIIPSSVTDMSGVFSNCTSLETAPVIPSNVESLNNTFSGCSSLKTYVGSTDSDGDFSNFVIPNSVTDMQGAFGSCTSLTKAPTIPNSVDNLIFAFVYCDNLTGNITINANATSYDYCFCETVKPITLTGSSTILSELAGTATNGNVTVR